VHVALPLLPLLGRLLADLPLLLVLLLGSLLLQLLVMLAVVCCTSRSMNRS
jgi:hypothetical protein